MRKSQKWYITFSSSDRIYNVTCLRQWTKEQYKLPKSVGPWTNKKFINQQITKRLRLWQRLQSGHTGPRLLLVERVENSLSFTCGTSGRSNAENVSWVTEITVKLFGSDCQQKLKKMTSYQRKLQELQTWEMTWVEGQSCCCCHLLKTDKISWIWWHMQQKCWHLVWSGYN